MPFLSFYPFFELTSDWKVLLQTLVHTYCHTVTDYSFSGKESIVVMAIGPTGAGKSSLLNALLCPTIRFCQGYDCHFKTGSGVKSVTRNITWQQARKNEVEEL